MYTSIYKLILISGTPGSRFIASEQMLVTRKGAFTNIIQLVVDVNLRPSTVYYAPIFSDEPGDRPPIIGAMAGAVSFDDLLRSALVSEIGQIDCVISTKSGQKFTLSFSSGDIKVIGEGDFHDTKFDKYKSSLNTGILTNYIIDLYPTKDFEAKIMTNQPALSCAAIILCVVITSSLLFAYVVIESRFEGRLVRQAKENLIQVVSRDAKLQQKKVYVRYISHEVSMLFECVMFSCTSFMRHSISIIISLLIHVIPIL